MIPNCTHTFMYNAPHEHLQYIFCIYTNTQGRIVNVYITLPGLSSFTSASLAGHGGDLEGPSW